MSWNIRSWRVSCYENNKSKWIYGMLTCSSSGVSFIPEHIETRDGGSTWICNKHQTQSVVGDSQSVDKKGLYIEYTDIVSVKKTTSMVLFSAVTVSVRGGTVYWFSSLPDHSSVYSMIHHFAHQRLLDSSKKEKAIAEPTTRTVAGQRLLQSIEDSEQTLAAAAGELWGQGRQLAKAAIMMQEVHEDLDVADRLLTSLDSWLGQWRLPPEYKCVDLVNITKGDVPEDQDQEVLYSELYKDQWRPQQLCIMRMSKTGFIFLDQHQHKIQAISWLELSRVFVVSPWEAVLTKHVAGRASVNVSVVSVSLLPVLHLIQKRVPHLMDYEKPPVPAEDMQVVKKNSKPQGEDLPKTLPSGSCTKGVVKELGSEKRLSAASDGFRGSSTKQQQWEKGVSEGELQILSSRLGALKSLATAVGEEVTIQNMALDSLTCTVDRADIRVQDANRHINRMS